MRWLERQREGEKERKRERNRERNRNRWDRVIAVAIVSSRLPRGSDPSITSSSTAAHASQKNGKKMWLYLKGQSP